MLKACEASEEFLCLLLEVANMRVPSQTLSPSDPTISAQDDVSGAVSRLQGMAASAKGLRLRKSVSGASLRNLAAVTKQPQRLSVAGKYAAPRRYSAVGGSVPCQSLK